MPRMSQAARKQILVIDLCRSIRDAVKKSFSNTDEEVPGKINLAMGRLRHQEEAALAYTGCDITRGEDERLVLAPDEYKPYAEMLADLKVELFHCYNGSTINVPSYVVMGLGLAEDIKRRMPREPVERWLTWHNICLLLEEIRSLYPITEEAHGAAFDHGCMVLDHLEAKVVRL